MDTKKKKRKNQVLVNVFENDLFPAIEAKKKSSSEEKSTGGENSLAIKKLALFVTLLMFPHQNWFMKFIILTIDQEFIACSVLRTGNLRVSSMTRLSFDQTRAFSF